MAVPAAESKWQARNPEFEKVVRDAFEKQSAMALIGVSLDLIVPGEAHLVLPCHDQVMSHIPPVVHGGTISMIADSAMGFAALSLAEPGAQGVTAEYKINFLSPAIGERLIARGTVVKPGSKLTVARADVAVVQADGREKAVATAIGTLIPI